MRMCGYGVWGVHVVDLVVELVAYVPKIKKTHVLVVNAV